MIKYKKKNYGCFIGQTWQTLPSLSNSPLMTHKPHVPLGYCVYLEGDNITSVIFLSPKKNYNFNNEKILNKPKLKDIQNNWPVVLFKSVMTGRKTEKLPQIRRS